MNFWPELGLPVQHAFQFFYGLLLLLVLAHQLSPHWHRFLVSERWGGYAQSGIFADAMHRPVLAPLVLVGWAGCAVALLCDWHPVLAALGNVLLCRYYFIAMRWRGVLRGFGAPGFMLYWMGGAVLLLAITRLHLPSLHPLAVLYLQIDLSLIMISSGFYKFRSGYLQGEGMDYGMVNPMWGLWTKFFRQRPTSHLVFRILNQIAWSSQLTSAVLMLVPATRWLGGLAEIATYAFIATQIRLGWLAEQMMLTGLIFFTSGTFIGEWWAAHWPLPATFYTTSSAGPTWMILSLSVALWFQLFLKPLCHAGLFYNFYGRRRLPTPLQLALDTYSNFFGVIIWRVFTVDILNFYVNIYSVAPSGQRSLISEWTNPRNLRFWHVGEAIVVTSLFTTLKYYPSDDALFRNRLLRYARTFSTQPGYELIFEYVSIKKISGRFQDLIACRYHVDAGTDSVRAEVVDFTCFPNAAHNTSPLHEAARPGTYAPKHG